MPFGNRRPGRCGDALSGIEVAREDALPERSAGTVAAEGYLHASGEPTVSAGQTVTAPLVAEDEFSLTVLDPAGERQTYPRDKVKVKIDNPMSAHFTLLGKYTDAEMHNVLAYLQTLK